MTHLESAVVVVKAATLTLGGLITYFSLKAYRRTGTPALRALGAGFGLITLGALFAGLLDVFVSTNVLWSVLVESTLSLLGFAIITYSLYVD